MAVYPQTAEDCIKRALPEVVERMRREFAEAGGSPEPGSALDQAGLLDGEEIVLDYLRHGEPGLALEHLIYMIHEAGLAISIETYQLIERAGLEMEMDPQLWELLR